MVIYPFHITPKCYIRVGKMLATWKQSAERLVTAESGNSPVAANAGRKRRQLEDKGPYVGVGVGVRGCDVDPGVGARTLAHLGLPGYQHRRVVVNIDQVDLEGSRPAGLRRAWGEARGKRGGKEIKGWDGEIITARLREEGTAVRRRSKD